MRRITKGIKAQEAAPDPHHWREEEQQEEEAIQCLPQIVKTQEGLIAIQREMI